MFLQTLRVLVVLFSTCFAIFVIRRTKRFILGKTRTNTANFFEFVMIVLVILMLTLTLLHIFECRHEHVARAHR